MEIPKSRFVKGSVRIFYVLLFAFSFFFTALAHVPITTATAPVNYQISVNPETLVQQGKAFYDAGQFAEAATVLQQAADAFRTQGNGLQQAIALTNLALAYQQLAQWSEAQAAITSSLQLVQTATKTDQFKVRGAALDVQGQLYLAQGNPKAALESFSSAVAAYTKAGDDTGVIRSQINQAQALQAAGLYPRALDTLQEVKASLEQQPDSQIKAIGSVGALRAIALRSLGNILRLVGSLDESQQVLEQSLAVAQALQSPQDISAALLGLGNTARAKADTSAALNYYQQATDAAPAVSTTKLQAQLNQFSLLVEEPHRSTNRELVLAIQSQLSQLPPSRASVDARINFARSLMKLGTRDWGLGRGEEDAGTGGQEDRGTVGEVSASSTSPQPQASSPSFIAEQLSTAVQQAKHLEDPIAESYALGQLGALYEQTKQWRTAQQLTEKALILAQSVDASDVAYSWQWQLGRLLNEQGNTQGAIAAYTAAVDSLKDLRGDLVSINPDVQFSFRKSVEPVYRELVSLLLQPQAKPENLAQAPNVIESLQQAELINFFREDCLTVSLKKIEEIDPKAAVIYTIVLDDRLEVVLSVPEQPLRHYPTFKPKAEVESVFAQLRQELAPLSVDPRLNRGGQVENAEPDSERGLGVQERTCRGLGVQGRECSNLPIQQQYLPLAQQVYDWIIRPAEQDIAVSKAETLVFVLDGPLLNLPMAVLHDRKQFLVEKYAIAYTPGLQLLDSKPLTRGELSALKAGLSESSQGFEALPFVKQELQAIQSEAKVPGEVLLNQAFTSTTIQKEIDSVPFPVVHMATHGQFSSKAEDTFILTWDDRLNINQLNNLLRSREVGNRRAIELLVLSACQTAAGDERAALGLAGVAVRAGARSTLATLWFVSDRATAELMAQFYKELADTNVSKAEALRRAQIALLQDSRYQQQPRLWAPYVLVGNWL